jgi:hypothetical protein
MTERMTKETKKQPAIDMNKVKSKLLQQKADIARLEKEADELREEIATNQAEQHRVMTESKLAIDDSELARSFSQKNYAPLLLTLFEKPSKQIRNTAIIMLLLSITTAIAAGYFSAGYLSYTHSMLIDKKIEGLQEKTNQSLLLQQQLKNTIDQQNRINSNPISVKNIDNSRINNAVITPNIQKTSTPTNPTKNKLTPANSEKQQRVLQQATSILRYVKSAEKQEGFLNNYVNDKTQFAQLYLIVMQYASNNNIYYESYLKVIEELGISDTIAPKTVEDLLQIDLDFLHAAYSGWIITTKKKTNGWRYREKDKRFSSFYNYTLDYDLGAWQIVNESNDYNILPDIFLLNMERITQQVTFNNKGSALQQPKYIYYLAYPENSKNKAIESLLNQNNLIKTNGKLKINTSKTNMPLKQNVALTKK